MHRRNTKGFAMTDLDKALYAFVNAAVVLLFLLLLAVLVSFLHNFFCELKYLNYEIKRTDGSERRCWMQRRKKLLLSLLPFVKY